MTKPPERIRVLMERQGGWDALTVEEEINMSLQSEAWAAMVRGECVKTNCHIHTIRGGTLQWWSSEWISTPHLEAGPYSIVPDPSKPKEVDKSEYERDRKNLITHLDTATWKYSERPGHMTDMIFDLIEKYYQRKP